MAAGSLKRINRFALGEARTHKKFFIIANIILGMGGLLYLFTSSYSQYETYDADAVMPRYIETFKPSGLGVFLLVVGCSIGLMGAACVFRDMNNIQLGDVQLSLPMTANERYFSKVLALFYLHVLPAIVWAGVPTLYHTIMTKHYGAEESEYLPLMFMCMMAGMLFVNCVTILCTVCCGALAESIYFTIIAVCCISAAPLLIWYNITAEFAGRMSDPGIEFMTWSLSFIVGIFRNEEEVSTQNCMLLLNCAVSLIVTALISFIYKKRDARTVGTPIANRIFFECIMFGGLSTIYAITFFRTEAYIGIIIVAVIYMVIHVITHRGKLSVKKFLGWLVKFGVSTAVYVGLAALGYLTGGFGTMEHVPSHIEMADIEITVTNENGDYVTYTKGLVAEERNREGKATAEQVRQVLNIFQSNGMKREKSADDFFRRLNGDNYWNRYSSYLQKCSVGICYFDKKDSQLNNMGMISERFKNFNQHIDFNTEERAKICAELDELGFLNKKIESGKDDYYYDAF